MVGKTKKMESNVYRTRVLAIQQQQALLTREKDVMIAHLQQHCTHEQVVINQYENTEHNHVEDAMCIFCGLVERERLSVLRRKTRIVLTKTMAGKIWPFSEGKLLPLNEFQSLELVK